MLDNFSAEDIFYLADTFYYALVGFVGIMIIFPPKKVSFFYIPFFFMVKYIGTLFVNLVNYPQYHGNPILLIMMTIIFYSMVIIYISINHSDEKIRYISYYFFMSLFSSIVVELMFFLFDVFNLKEHLISVMGDVDTGLAAEFIFRRFCMTILYFALLKFLSGRLIKIYNPPKLFQYIFTIGFLIIEIPGVIVYSEEVGTVNVDIGYAAIFFVVIVPFIVFLTVLFTYLQDLGFKKEKALLEKQNEIQYEYYSSLQKNQQAIRKINHDILNHISTLKILSENNDREAFNAYAEEIISSYTVPRIEYCENHIVNAAVLCKVALAKEKDIDFSVNLQLPEKLSIKSTDIVSIFTNLLDNAIEECERLPEGAKREISLSCVCSKGAVAICCENSCLDGKSAKKLISKKGNALLHGLGTKIIKDTVKKYNGTYSAEAEDGKFRVSTLMDCKG
ncbi:MAG: sensor histidine kinase [Oscillospiraceae bacterium]